MTVRPLKIQNGQFHTYWINMYRAIHQNVWLIWFFTSQSTIFQLCWGGSSLVEPVLNKDKCVLLKDTTQWHQWGSNPQPLCFESSTLPLSKCAPSLSEWKGFIELHHVGSKLTGPPDIRKLFSLFLIQKICCGYLPGLQIFENYFLHFSPKTYVVGTQ